jgi:hypothetical protein
MSVFWKVFGFLRDRELEWQKEEYKRTGGFTCSGAIATESWIADRTALIQNMIASEERVNNEDA